MEFFAGAGMARLGLGPSWRPLFANDVDPMKAAAYRTFFGDPDLLALADVKTLRAADLPGPADLAWASFPCQDLSLAGAGRGLSGERSGLFWAFWKLMRELDGLGRFPRLVVVENVCGLASARSGRDLGAVIGALAERCESVAPLVLDAARFLPQSRPRLFLVGFTNRAPFNGPVGPPALPPAMLAVLHSRDALTARASRRIVHPALPETTDPVPALADLLEPDPPDAPWNTPEKTSELVGLMAPAHRAKLDAAIRSGKRVVGTLYRRTRNGPDGGKIQRAEVRFDGVAGCLRTPAGGSSRQTLLIVENGDIRSRLLSGREAARLMGIPDAYPLPARLNQALHLAGDGVAVPVVRHLARTLLEPALAAEDAAAGVKSPRDEKIPN